MTESRRLRTQAERDADGTTWRPEPPKCAETNDVLGLRCVRERGHDGYHIHDHGNAVAAWGAFDDHDDAETIARRLNHRDPPMPTVK